MRKVLFGVVAMSVLVAGQSYASTIDFRKAVWNPHGDDSITVGQTTAQANGDHAKLFWDDDEGFGITSRRDDSEHQINGNERLDVSFVNELTLTGFSVSDLFPQFDEAGQYRIIDGKNAGNWITFDAKSLTGDLFVNLGHVLATGIQFRATPPIGAGFANYFNNYYDVNDFSVTTLVTDPAAVPEPTSMLLLGTGLVGLAARFRRKHA